MHAEGAVQALPQQPSLTQPHSESHSRAAAPPDAAMHSDRAAQSHPVVQTHSVADPAIPRRPQATQAPPPRRSRAAWWLVPLVILILGVIVWLLLGAFPLGERDRPRGAATETIGEGRAERGSTAIDVTDGVEESEGEPRRSEAARTETRGEVTERQAVSAVQDYVTARNFYDDVDDDCIRVSSLGYRNRGYTVQVSDSCDSRTLGRWRVDTLTGELYRQREDGRYLRP